MPSDGDDMEAVPLSDAVLDMDGGEETVLTAAGSDSLLPDRFALRLKKLLWRNSLRQLVSSDLKKKQIEL